MALFFSSIETDICASMLVGLSPSGKMVIGLSITDLSCFHSRRVSHRSRREVEAIDSDCLPSPHGRLQGSTCAAWPRGSDFLRHRQNPSSDGPPPPQNPRRT